MAIENIHDLLTKLNRMMTTHLEQHLLREPTARDRILALEDWSESVLHYSDFFQLLPERDLPAVQILQEQIAELLAPIQAFLPYLAKQHVDPLLDAEYARELANG